MSHERSGNQQLFSEHNRCITQHFVDDFLAFRLALNVVNIRIVKILFYKTWEKRLKRVFESVSEIAIEVCIDERIKGRVEVSDPEKNGH